MRTGLPAFDAARVLVVGDVMLDRYWQGPAARISPEAPVPVVRVAEREDRPGGAANVARNIAALGAPCELLGLVGEDEAAQALRAGLAGVAGLTARLVTVPGLPTVTKLRVLSRHQQLLRLDFEQAFPASAAERLRAPFAAALDGVGAVVCSDYAKGALGDVASLIARARARDVPVVVDPKGRDFCRYRGATVLTPNQAEFEAVAGACRDDAELAARAEALRADLGLAALLVTRSERGMTLVEAGRPPLHLPTHAREVYDVTGAGDTVVATLAAALAAGETLRGAAALANHAAGVVVGKLGTASVSPAELARALEAEREPLPRGVVDADTLQDYVARARAAGERIVMTNGCFDLLHPGHVAYLAQAAALGDRLVVAVNDDDSVRRLKGAERPVNPLASRMAVLAGLRSVDWVVPFGADTPRELICRLRPDVLVKGGDYRPEQIAGHDCVRAAGGEVVVVPFVAGHSTTAVIERLRS